MKPIYYSIFLLMIFGFQNCQPDPLQATTAAPSDALSVSPTPDPAVSATPVASATPAPPAKLSATVQCVIHGLYISLYARAAEYNGYAYWVGSVASQPGATSVNLLNANSSMATLNQTIYLATNFVQNSGYDTLMGYSEMSDTVFVDKIYLHATGLTPESASEQYWVNMIQGFVNQGMNTKDARSNILARFVLDMINFDSTNQGSLSSAVFAEGVAMQNAFFNKMTVSFRFGNTNTTLLSTTSASFSDPVFQASTRAVAYVSSNSSRDAMLSKIADALMQGNLNLIGP